LLADNAPVYEVAHTANVNCFEGVERVIEVDFPCVVYDDVLLVH